MARDCKYVVTIGLPRRSNHVATYVAPFKEGGDNDLFDFKRTKVTIVCERSVKYSGNEVLDNIQNSIYHQVSKALLVLFLSNMENARINNITIVRKYLRKPSQIVASRHYTKTKQPFPIFSFHQDPITSADKVLDETVESISYRNIVSHWIRGFTSEVCFQQFDSLWRAFERTAVYGNRNNPVVAERSQEKSSLRKMRTNLITHSHSLVNSSNLAGSYTYNDIKIFRWREFLHHEYSTSKGAQRDCENFRDQFVIPNNDGRLAELMQHIFPNIKKRAQIVGMDVALWNLINGKNLGDRSNHELVAVLLCKYAYYYRCTIFHGESLAQPVILPPPLNIDEDRVIFLNRLLEATVRDWLENFHLL